MKSSTEHFNQWWNDKSGNANLPSAFAAAMLDSYRQAMSDAAEIAMQVSAEEFANPHHVAAGRILAARDKKTNP